MMMSRPNAIRKHLTRNDAGETRGHQAGVHVPRRQGILEFFPELHTRELNPRCTMEFIDSDNNIWKFNFIYYNNKYFGGTRNEYRLTGMTAFIRFYQLRSGDSLILKRSPGDKLRISFERTDTPDPRGKLKLGTTWKIVNI